MMPSGNVTVAEIEKIAGSVLRDYGIRLSLQRITTSASGWMVVLGSLNASDMVVHVHGSPHDIRRCIMSALEIDG
jgi:hypothetical protein